MPSLGNLSVDSDILMAAIFVLIVFGAGRNSGKILARVTRSTLHISAVFREVGEFEFVLVSEGLVLIRVDSRCNFYFMSVMLQYMVYECKFACMHPAKLKITADM